MPEILIVLFGSRNHKNSGQFDKPNPRGPMAKDLQYRLVREKPTKAEVLALLGEPDFMTKADRRRSDFLSYNFGIPDPIHIDYYSLDIYYDANDCVKRVCIHQH